MLRLWVVRTVVAVVFASLPQFVAAGPPASSNAPDGSEVDRAVQFADHLGTVSGETMVWRSTYRLAASSGARPSYVAFTHPLPESAEVVETTPAGAVPRRGVAGGVVGMELPEDVGGRRASIVVRQRATPASQLRPPMAGAAAEQRVVVRKGHWEPADSSAIRKYPGYLAPGGYDDATRDRFDTLFGEPPSDAEDVVYLRPRAVAGPGLTGDLTTVGAYRMRMVGILGGVLLVLGLVAGVGYKLLESRAQEERAEAIIDDHGAMDPRWDDLDS